MGGWVGVRVGVGVRVRRGVVVRVRVRARLTSDGRLSSLPMFLVRVRVGARVGVRVRVRVRGSGLGVDSLPMFHMVMAGCFSRSSWRRSDALAWGTQVTARET